MNCRDLMVGDFVQDEHNFPMQVTSVGEDYAYATFEGLEGDPWEFDDKNCPPSPIEITRDILEKNDWKDKPSMLSPWGLVQTYFLVKGEECIHIEFNGDTRTIWLNYENDNDGVYSDIIIPCKYVHQLQQELRLAGMTELANNFKV